FDGWFGWHIAKIVQPRRQQCHGPDLRFVSGVDQRQAAPVRSSDYSDFRGVNTRLLRQEINRRADILEHRLYCRAAAVGFDLPSIGRPHRFSKPAAVYREHGKSAPLEDSRQLIVRMAVAL